MNTNFGYLKGGIFYINELKLSCCEKAYFGKIKFQILEVSKSQKFGITVIYQHHSETYYSAG